VGRLGVMERDPLMVQGERKLIEQAERLIVLVDSSKFRQRSSLIVCALDRVHTIVTDDGIREEDAAMLEAAGVTLVVAKASARREALRLPETA
jgi:DeoR family ulaG and ulaABCDEF operon transcriptional repressor